MEKITLKATLREELGKSACKHLRHEGCIPAIVYKGGGEGIPVYVDNKELWHALHTEAGENAIITLDISGGKKSEKKTVMVQEKQTDPINEQFIHVDFHEISLTEIIKVKVPVTVKGEAAGVKEEDGVLNQAMWEIEVECKAMEVPEHIYVQVDDLKIGDAIHVKEVVVPDGVKVMDDPEQMVVSVNPPHVEEEPAEEEISEEGEEPELIQKGKKEEEEASEEAESSQEEEQ